MDHSMRSVVHSETSHHHEQTQGGHPHSHVAVAVQGVDLLNCNITIRGFLTYTWKNLSFYYVE